MGYDVPAIEAESRLGEQAVSVLIASLTRLETVDMAQDLQRGLGTPVEARVGDDGDVAIGICRSAELCAAFVDAVEQRMLDLADDRPGLAWLRTYHDQTRAPRLVALRDPGAMAQVAHDVLALLAALDGGDMPTAEATLRRRYSLMTDRLARLSDAAQADPVRV